MDQLAEVEYFVPTGTVRAWSRPFGAPNKLAHPCGPAPLVSPRWPALRRRRDGEQQPGVGARREAGGRRLTRETGVYRCVSSLERRTPRPRVSGGAPRKRIGQLFPGRCRTLAMDRVLCRPLARERLRRRCRRSELRVGWAGLRLLPVAAKVHRDRGVATGVTAGRGAVRHRSPVPPDRRREQHRLFRDAVGTELSGPGEGSRGSGAIIQRFFSPSEPR